jgi:asparagine synthase (glutamine-hydrolysing)
MCGVAGQWVRGQGARSREQMTRAIDALAHRGPNDCGQDLFAVPGGQLLLGHTRLSIIDLSQGGHQPMYRENKRYAMIFNGEIYNYRELRAELESIGQRFASDSDSEVLLAAWSHWGEAALPRLRGMFALAIHDSERATLTVSRDGFGIKPLAYFHEDGVFAFASEVRALRELLPRQPTLNTQQAYDYLVFGSYDDSQATFFEGIRHLLPGHVLTFDLARGSIRSIRRWWSPAIAERRDSFDQAVERVRESFLTNVRLHLRSDVPLGAALSGGIDSSAIVCGMRYVEPAMPIHTFSYVARGSPVDEERWADMVNARVGAIPHKVVASPADLVADLEDMIRAQGEPFGSTSIYAQYRVFGSAREQGITVMLEGQGADELFAGYHGYPGAVVHELLEQGRIPELVEFARGWTSWPDRSWKRLVLATGHTLVPSGLRGRAMAMAGRTPTPEWLDRSALEAVGVRLEPFMPAWPSDASGRRLAATLRESLTERGIPALLRHADRNSMRWSIESRVPFLTTDLADYVLSLPADYLIGRDGQTKRVLRAALRGIVPDEILDRRDKIGFATPEHEWLRQIAPQARAWVAEDLGLPFFRQDVVRRELDAILDGTRPFSWQAWRWINFSVWYRMFFHA